MIALLCNLVTLFVLVLFVRAILSWFPISPDSPVAAIRNFLTVVTEPVLAPVRRVIPPLQIGGAAIDISFIVVLLGIRLLAAVIFGC